MFLCKLVKLRH